MSLFVVTQYQMLFNSYQFIFIFLPVVLFSYFYLNKRRYVIAGKVFLIIASMVFYGYWNINYVPLLACSIAFNYIIGASLCGGTSKIGSVFSNITQGYLSRKQVLIIGLVFNLSLLAYFKYASFLVENFNLIVGGSVNLPTILLPLAISFFTFQMIAYLVDCYSGKARDYGFLDYALFVMFFPQLIAGPIVHHGEIVPQYENRRNLFLNFKNVGLGVLIFTIGLFKKVVIADTFAVWATAGFDNATSLSTSMSWVTSLSYTFQLYFDFSGYTDMAIGAALMFNIRLPDNFNSPYKAVNIQEFWRRWHITLSRFLRDYLYIPLGGNRYGEFRTYVALFVTFLIGGLWHGASWMFVIWGAIHGGALVVHRVWKRIGGRMPVVVAWFLTFNFVNFAWVFFRAKDWASAERVLFGMAGNGELSEFLLIVHAFVVENAYLVSIVIALAIVLVVRPTANVIHGRRVGWALVSVIGVMGGLGAINGELSEFLLIVHAFVVENAYLVSIVIALAIVLVGRPTTNVIHGRRVEWELVSAIGMMGGVVALIALSVKARPTEFLYFNF